MPYKNIEINGPRPVAEQAKQQNHFYKGFSSIGNNPGSRLYDFDLVKQDILNNFNKD